MQLYLLVILTIVVDQLTKAMVTEKMFLGESISLIDNVFHLTYILNPGAAFGMLANQQWFFIAIAALAVGLFVWFRKELLLEPFSFQYGISMFVGGAIGNLIDRVYIGKVVDFFDFRIWPIFNVADIAICVGMGLMLWSVFQVEKKK